MSRFRLNMTMFLVLVSAILSMQWTTAHIHLEEHHDHDGSHHMHDVKAHAHQSITQDDNSSSSTYQIDNHYVNVVDIDHQGNTKSGNQIDDHVIALTSDSFLPRYISLQSSVLPIEFNSSELQYIDYSTIHLRAPPKIA